MKHHWMCLAVLTWGCSGSDELEPVDSGSIDDTSVPADTSDSAEESDSGGSDTGEEQIGLLGKIGSAMVTDAGFEGTEDLYFIADYGQGEDICRIRYTLTTIGPRTDCAECEWAYDLLLSGPELIAEMEPGCLATVGVEGSDVGVLDNQVVSYGYNPDYFGHISVLFVLQDGVWGPVDHGAWDQNKGTFVYDWQSGYQSF